jgi:hypothetical protein
MGGDNQSTYCLTKECSDGIASSRVLPLPRGLHSFVRLMTIPPSRPQLPIPAGLLFPRKRPSQDVLPAPGVPPVAREPCVVHFLLALLLVDGDSHV